MSRRNQRKQVFSNAGVELPEEIITSPAVIRLEDQRGATIPDLKTHFKNIKVVVFYFGSVFGEASLREFHRDLVTLAAKESKEVALIYVSTDTKFDEMKSVVQGKNWLRMTFHDGSDFAAIAKSASAEVTELLRGEDFVLSHEIEEYDLPLEGLADPLQYDYVRPLSRAALANHVGALKTPTMSIYHLPSHRFIDRYARLDQFRNGNSQRYIQLWKEGKSGGVSARDLFKAMKWSLILALVVGLYFALVQFGGEQYNVLPDLFDRFASGDLFPQRAGAQTTGAFITKKAVAALPTISVTRAAI